jgi:tetratricopeptide (TPR) repeat protein
MAIWSERHNLPAKRSTNWSHARQQLLLIPEAVVLLALLLIGWATQFPPLLGALALLVACLFGIRLLLIAVAARKLASGAYDLADRLLGLALKLHPWSLDALLLRAQGLTQRGDDEAAEAVLRRAAQLYPGDESLQSVLASSMLAQGRLTEGWRIVRDAQTGDAAATGVDRPACRSRRRQGARDHASRRAGSPAAARGASAPGDAG